MLRTIFLKVISDLAANWVSVSERDSVNICCMNKAWFRLPYNFKNFKYIIFTQPVFCTTGNTYSDLHHV